MKDRAHKLIAQSGLMSRRKAEEAILQGRVALNGVIFRTMGQLVDPSTDLLTVDGNPVLLKTEKKTFVFYKPRGVVTTKSDERGRPTIMDYFKEDPTLNPVGRLDYESEGLLLMTHDGDLLLRLTHPRYGVKKIYEVNVSGNWNEDLRQALLTGVNLEDGPGKFDVVESLDVPRSVWKDEIHSLRVIVSEGRNRFIRRMFSALELEVTQLKRVQIGDYLLGSLKPGEKREV